MSNTQYAKYTKRTGQPRLKDPGMKKVLDDYMLCSATFGCDLEFHTFWESVLDRLENDRCSTDWNEPMMAKYIGKNLLHDSSGTWRAPWQSGYASVPPGFTCYAPNTIEVTWRLIKNILGDGRRFQTCAELMTKVWVWWLAPSCCPSIDFIGPLT